MRQAAHLSTVDELGQGDVSVVAKDVDVLELGVGAVLEFDAEEVADIRGRATAELNGNGRGEVSWRKCVLALFYNDTGLHTDASEFWVFRGDASLMEEGNEWLVCGLDQHKLERVAVERNALKRSKDSVEDRAPGD